MKFSRRLPGSLQANRLNEEIERLRRCGSEIIDLTESNPTQAGFYYPEAEILQALGNPLALSYEPSARGLPTACEAVAALHGVPPGSVILTASTSEAYSFLFKLLADAGDEVLVPRPSYPLFDFLAALDSVRAVPYDLEYQDGWSFDAAALEHRVTAKTRAVIVVNPNNPTGSFVKDTERDALLGVCERHGLAILSDEVFAPYPFAADLHRVATMAGPSPVLTFVLSGLSKLCGLPQMKLGWIVAGGPKALAGEALHRLELMADMFLSVNTPVQHALPELFELAGQVTAQIRARTRSNLETLQRLTADSPAHVLNVEGGWYATLQVPRIRSEEDWALELLSRHSVLVQPGYFYDFQREAFLILSLLTRPAVFEEGVRRLVSGLLHASTPR